MRYCPNMRLVMVSEWALRPQYLDVLRVRCKQWSCPYCSVVNGQQWKSHLLTRLQNSEFANRQWALITLTADAKYHKQSPTATLLNLQSVWKKMRHRLMRYNGAPFDYIRVFERHTKGVYGGFHMHIICDLGMCYEKKAYEFSLVRERERRAKALGLKPRKRLKRERHPARWIKDACREAKGGFIADFRPLKGDSKRAVKYTMKYATKQIDLNEFPKHMRRIQTTRAIGSPKKSMLPRTRKWKARSAIFREDLRVYERIFDISIKHEITIEDDFSDGELWYPPELK